MIKIVRGSLIDQDVDVIVNAANKNLRGGGGIDGIVHDNAGPELLEFLELSYPYGIETSDVAFSPGFNLKQPYIIHTAGPIWKGGEENEDIYLSNCFWNSLSMAKAFKLKSIGFCSISTGIYKYPLVLAAPIAINTIRKFILDHPIDVTLALYGSEEYDIYLDCYNGDL